MKRFKHIQWQNKLHELQPYPDSANFFLRPLNTTGNIYVRVDVASTEEADLQRLAKSRLRFAAR